MKRYVPIRANSGLAAPRIPKSLAKRPEQAAQTAILAYLALRPDISAWKTGGGAFRASYTNKSGETRSRFVPMGKKGVSDIIGWMRRPCPGCLRPTDYQPADPAHDAAHPCRFCRNVGAVARFLALEVKAPQSKNGVTPEQRAFLDAVTRDGGIAGVVTSVADVVTLLRGHGIA